LWCPPLMAECANELVPSVSPEQFAVCPNSSDLWWKKTSWDNQIRTMWCPPLMAECANVPSASPEQFVVCPEWPWSLGKGALFR
jgi:hypothetical protein